ncbi:MAG: hypothetical protein AABN33_18480 [Acidobacteriota bacterium]
MRHPSKKTALIADAERARVKAVEERDVEAFAAAIAEIKRLEASPDTYTCLSCGTEFGDGKHVDLLVASILVFDESGVAVQSMDYGLLATEMGKSGRRIKFCGGCSNKWKIPIADYVEMR